MKTHVLLGGLHAEQWHGMIANRRAAMPACSAPASIGAGSIWRDQGGAKSALRHELRFAEVLIEFRVSIG